MKAVALVQGKQTGHNEFDVTYGELYRKYGTTSYKKVKKPQFNEVMAWLTEWHQSLVGDNPF